ncbi:hypothetical protein Sru01_26130 [Sphaerisporangium rufum]|uniref:Sugar lactone lactonase YvrE n=1 Tax=Sphaerisporangium rufum TaxID=1381558 RepID=A0A919R0Q4_9ACTN|nr:hypothetical protein [Sphaerisporangium rufum]GII77631.1 hypothetical protein Sru01_26130 [Sphaerisporangium rufum]
MKLLRRNLVIALCLGTLVATGSGPAALADRRQDPATSSHRSADLVIPGDNFHPESVAATPDGTVFASSIVTGEIVRFRPGSTTAQTFLPAGVNLGTAGVLADPRRGVLWACAIDLSFQTPTVLQAYRLSTGRLEAAYTLPDGGVCADITLAQGAVYLTDTTNPTATPQPPGRILRLATPNPLTASGGKLSVWSQDPAFTSGAGLQINGIAFDGARSLYTTNYNSGELIKVDIAPDGTARPAQVVDLGKRFVNPDGIRMLDRDHLLVPENPGPLSVVDVRRRTATVVTSLDQPSSVAVTGSSVYVAEGQIPRLQTGQQPNLPFKVRRLPAP